ncbi:MAG: D-alanyl-D-alanine carboxypeptidase/D-alanyl-D-alanine-endopeptidase [Bacteroidota bacterium]
MNIRLVICFLLLSASLLAAGCTVTDHATRPDNPVDALRLEIDTILSDTIFTQSDAAIKIVSLEDGAVLYERNGARLMRPASNTKLITSSAALGILGTNHEFRTSILADSLLPDGIVHGSLYLKGYGDPGLTVADLDSMIAQLKSIGIKAIHGNVVADASWFDDLYWGEGWMWDDEPYSYEAGICALSVNKNCVKVSIIPGTFPGEGVQVLIDPPTQYVSLLNTARTVTDTALVPLNVTRMYKDRLNALVVSGEVVAKRDTIHRWVTVWRPELYAATLLKERMEADSIIVRGQPTIGVALPWSHELAYRRRSIDSVLFNLNKMSDNLAAENTLKSIAVARGGMPGSAKYGLFQTNVFLSELGIDTTKYRIVDGSGVSHYNLLTADMLIQLLVSMTNRWDIFGLFYESLPIAGVDGTLEMRMRGTKAEGNLRAKTGSIGGVSSLSGYVTTADGERLAFSILMQDFILPSRLYRNAQDAIGALLAGFSRTAQAKLR